MHLPHLPHGALEVIGATLLAGMTALVAVMTLDISGIAGILIPVGSSAIVGYFSAQITVRSEIAEMRVELRMMREELHRYYRVKESRGNE